MKFDPLPGNPAEGFLLRVIIFANGTISHPQMDASQIQSEDIIIAADGGARHCLALGLVPRLVIGDFDSLSKDELQVLKQAGATLQKFPYQKDETDLELALHKALVFSPNEIIILGGLGARWDMTLANILLTAHPDFEDQPITFRDGTQKILLLRPGQENQISGKIGDTISLIPVRGDAIRVTTKGLEYPLENETLLFGSPRGVSNVLKNPEISIQFEEGLLLIIHNIPQ